MKRSLAAIPLALVALTANIASADTAADSLMRASHLAYYYAGDDGSAHVTMVMTSKKGKTRTREFVIVRSDETDLGDQRYFTHFSQPTDVSRTTFMVHKHAESNDDRWLYVPSLDLVRRISANDRNSSFVGSDFSYEDVSGRHPRWDNHEIVGTEKLGERACTVIKATPKDKKTADYSYRKVWIDSGNLLPLREEYYDKNDKEVRRFEVLKVEEVQGFATPVVRKMTNLKKNQHTVLTFANVAYDIGAEYDRFTERILKNPPRDWIR